MVTRSSSNLKYKVGAKGSVWWLEVVVDHKQRQEWEIKRVLCAQHRCVSFPEGSEGWPKWRRGNFFNATRYREELSVWVYG